MPLLPNDPVLATACQNLDAQLRDAQRAGKLPLALVVRHLVLPDEIHVLFDHATLGRILRTNADVPLSTEEVRHDWVAHFRAAVTRGNIPLGLVVAEANGLISAAAWPGALAAACVPQATFDGAVCSALEEALHSAPDGLRRPLMFFGPDAPQADDDDVPNAPRC